MECIHPLKIHKSRVNSAGIVVGFDNYTVPCGRCISCRLNYANQWSTRIVSEAKEWKYSSFVTLTYNDENLPINENTGFATLVKVHCQNFFKEVRGKGVKLRYFLGGEYGSDDYSFRPHYHLCLFSNDIRITDNVFLERCWRKGFVYTGTLTRNSANYVAKYCVKKLGGQEAQRYVDRGIIPEFALMSRRPGIGYNYIKKYAVLVKRNGFVVVGGKKQSIPKYFGSLIFSEEDKAQRFLEKSQKEYEECLNDINSGKDYNYILERRKQLARNIKGRLSLKVKKL